MAVNVVVRGKWKSVEIEPSLFLQKDMNHLICIEELTDYNIVDTKNTEVIQVTRLFADKPIRGQPVRRQTNSRSGRFADRKYTVRYTALAMFLKA